MVKRSENVRRKARDGARKGLGEFRNVTGKTVSLRGGRRKDRTCSRCSFLQTVLDLSKAEPAASVPSRYTKLDFRPRRDKEFNLPREMPFTPHTRHESLPTSVSTKPSPVGLLRQDPYRGVRHLPSKQPVLPPFQMYFWMQERAMETTSPVRRGTVPPYPRNPT